VVEYEVRTSHLCAAAGVLEARFEEIFATYEERLLTMSNSLVAEAETREQLRAHAYSVLEEVAATPCADEKRHLLNKRILCLKLSGF
jgi:hypothetical protein